MLWLALAATQAAATPAEPCPADRICEVPLAISPAAAERLLGSRGEIWWINRDVLTVVARREPQATLCCAVQRPMRPIGRGLQAVSVRIPDIDSAILDVVVIPTTAPNLDPVWRGPAAPREPERSPLESVPISTFDLDSVHLGGLRRIAVYVPPGLAEGRHVPVIYMADGMMDSIRQIADAAIRSGRSGPVVLVGLPPGSGVPACPETRCNPRNQQYLIDIPGATPEQSRFDAHARFVLEEVIPYVESHYPVRRDRESRAAMGSSSGGAWAVTMAARFPETFGKVIALSVGWTPAVRAAAALGNARVFLGAGRLESASFLSGTTEAAALARAAGADAWFLTINSGHGYSTWDIAFAEALVWMFPPAPTAR